METPIQSNFLSNVMNAGQQSNALSSLFAGTRVFKPEPEPEPTPEPEPVATEAPPTLFAPKPAEENKPLTNAQLKSMARRKARTWGALLNVLFFVVEAFESWGMVRKDDERLIEDREKSAGFYDLENDLEYIAAKKRVADFDEFIEKARKNSELDEYELEMLEDAFFYELEDKNKRGELDRPSVTSILIEFTVGRLFRKAGPLSEKVWGKMAVR